LQRISGSVHAVSQQTLSTQLPDAHCPAAVQLEPLGCGVGVLVGVSVGVLGGVAVGVLVGVKVGVLVGVLLGVNVGVLVGVAEATGVPFITSQPAKGATPQVSPDPTNWFEQPRG
jgi:hypothetical protein